jgi:hypothetical protein
MVLLQRVNALAAGSSGYKSRNEENRAANEG